MSRFALAVVSFVVLSVSAGRAHADASAQRYGLGFFQGISTGDGSQVGSFLLSGKEYAAIFRGATQKSYDRYREISWREANQMLAAVRQLRNNGKTVQVVGVDVVDTSTVSGGSYARPAVVVTLKPVMFIEGRGRFVAQVPLRLVKVNNHWKLSNMNFKKD